MLINLFCLLLLFQSIDCFESESRPEIAPMFLKNDPFLQTESSNHRAIRDIHPGNEEGFWNNHDRFGRSSIFAQDEGQAIGVGVNQTQLIENANNQGETVVPATTTNNNVQGETQKGKGGSGVEYVQGDTVVTANDNSQGHKQTENGAGQNNQGDVAVQGTDNNISQGDAQTDDGSSGGENEQGDNQSENAGEVNNQSENGNDQGDNQVDEKPLLVDIGECEDRIHRKCVQVKYTEEEVENVRLYLAKRFLHTNPEKPLCKRLHVRKDVKCLTDKELSQFIRAYRMLYRRGVIDRYSKIHAAYWPATHKFAEGIPWHRWHVRQMERELQKINPRIAMPYWESYSEFAAPEKSSIWNFLGRAGHRNNRFCIPNGAFRYTMVRYPQPHCITRQWNSDGTITPWEAPEWLTSATQVAKNWTQYTNMIGFTGHFKLHLSIGGFYGDYSIPWATNDPIFYIFHAFPTDLALLKWQLSDDSFLVPQSYSGNNRLLPRSRMIVLSDIEKDTLAFYSKTKVREAFQVGFGDLCYIHDQLIRPINDLLYNIQREEPIALKALLEALPKVSFRRYFPKFADNTATAFDHFFPDIGHCIVEQNKCKPIPVALRYNETVNGLRQLERFRFDGGFDVTPLTFQAETLYYDFMRAMRGYGYCSPYAI